MTGKKEMIKLMKAASIGQVVEIEESYEHDDEPAPQEEKVENNDDPPLSPEERGAIDDFEACLESMDSPHDERLIEFEGKIYHKTRLITILMEKDRKSTDRLRRVRGLSKYLSDGNIGFASSEDASDDAFRNCSTSRAIQE
jgi:hypothetical protein